MQGKKIKEILKKHGVSEQDIASKMGTSRQNVNSKLKGDDIGLGYVIQIAALSNIPLQIFIDAAVEDENIAAEPEEEYKKAVDNEGAEKLKELDKEMKKMRAKIEELAKKQDSNTKNN